MCKSAVSRCLEPQVRLQTLNTGGQSTLRLLVMRLVVPPDARAETSTRTYSTALGFPFFSYHHCGPSFRNSNRFPRPSRIPSPTHPDRSPRPSQHRRVQVDWCPSHRRLFRRRFVARGGRPWRLCHSQQHHRPNQGYSTVNLLPERGNRRPCHVRRCVRQRLDRIHQAFGQEDFG